MSLLGFEHLEGRFSISPPPLPQVPGCKSSLRIWTLLEALGLKWMESGHSESCLGSHTAPWCLRSLSRPKPWRPGLQS